MVTLLSVKVPMLYTPPPLAALPSVIVSFDRTADEPVLTLNTPLALFPLTVTPADVPVIVVVAASVRVSTPLVRVIVCGVLNTPLSKSIVSAPLFRFAWVIASRSDPAPVSFVLRTV